MEWWTPCSSGKEHFPEERGIFQERIKCIPGRIKRIPRFLACFGPWFRVFWSRPFRRRSRPLLGSFGGADPSGNGECSRKDKGRIRVFSVVLRRSRRFPRPFSEAAGGPLERASGRIVGRIVAPFCNGVAPRYTLGPPPALACLLWVARYAHRKDGSVGYPQLCQARFLGPAEGSPPRGGLVVPTPLGAVRSGRSGNQDSTPCSPCRAGDVPARDLFLGSAGSCCS